MDDMMKMLKAKGKPVEGPEKEAQMEILRELVQHMSEIIGADVDGIMKPKEENQVVVSAENPEDMEQGLEMAKEVVEQMPEDDMDLEEEDEDIY